MIHRLVAGAAALIALTVAPGFAVASGPFGGFFEPRGGAYYSPLHFWAPAAYRVQFHFHGPECAGCRSTVNQPAAPAYAPATGTTIVTPAPTTTVPGSMP
jgi:hypothetical protein